MPFEGEALVIWGRAGARPLVLAAIHRPGRQGPVIEVVLAAMRQGRRPGMARRVLAARGPGVESPATVNWLAQDRRREVHWEEGGLKIWAGIGRRSVPARVPGWLLGGRAGGSSSLPTRAFMAHVEVVASEGGQVAPFAGRHRAVLFSTARLAADPSRLRLPLPKGVEATPELT